MQFFITILIGLSLGSFFTALLARYGTNQSIMKGRSKCPKCRHVLRWYDLVPFLSFIFLRGRCRYCRKGISFLYPLVEIITAVALLAFFCQYGFGFSWQNGVFLVALLGFILLLFFDYLYMILPDIVIVSLTIITLAFMVLTNPGTLPSALITGFILGGVFAILHIVSAGRWMGFGDVKLAFFIGLFFGYPLGPGIIFVSVWLAALLGFILIFSRRATLKTALPFGSFMAIVSIISTIFYYELSTFIRLFF
jgi:leader peptidase (prepilin peptidase)/N-methyltransferase